MEKELVGGELGSVAEYKVELLDGKLVLMVDHKDVYAEASIALKLSAEPIIHLVAGKMKELIPGKIDDLVLDEAVAMLLAKLAGG